MNGMREMSRFGLRYAMRCAASSVASLGLILLLQASAAHAGEVIMRDCLHGSEGNHTFGYTNSYGDQYGDDHGDNYGSAYSYSRANRGDLHRGFDGRFHRGFDGVAGDQNGGGTINGVDAGSRNGHRDGYATGYGNGSRSDYGSDSCVEVRRDLTNPYVITVPPPASEAQAREIAEARASLARPLPSGGQAGSLWREPIRLCGAGLRIRQIRIGAPHPIAAMIRFNTRTKSFCARAPMMRSRLRSWVRAQLVSSVSSRRPAGVNDSR